MPKGYTLQKIADAVGVSVGKVHNVVGDLIFNSEIENARGKSDVGTQQTPCRGL